LPFQNFMSHIEIMKFCQNHWSLLPTVTVLSTQGPSCPYLVHLGELLEEINELLLVLFLFLLPAGQLLLLFPTRQFKTNVCKMPWWSDGSRSTSILLKCILKLIYKIKPQTCEGLFNCAIILKILPVLKCPGRVSVSDPD
jgi:hypothetical protein